VNFLAHYYFDHRKGDPHFNLGLLLPDLVRNFSPGSKLKLAGVRSVGKDEGSLLDGSLQHADSDKIFHSWSGFHEMMGLVTSSIREKNDQIDKDWFIAHILVELVLDQYLLKIESDLAKRLYTDFEMLDMAVIQSFLARNDLPNFERFEIGMGHFMRVRYLEKYQETASIIFALGKICTKVNLASFTESQKVLIQVIIDNLLKQMPYKIEELRKELI
jgi:hypothetical protein